MDIKVEKSEEFALRIIKFTQYLRDKGEFVISKQLLRCGTSIGANIAEATYAESNDDMIHKLAISLKEASETRYWIKLLFRSVYIEERAFVSLTKDCEELMKLLISISKRLKSKKYK